MNSNKTKSSTVTNREEIIREAARMFALKGYHATTIDEIARAIGITKPSIYYYFKSKQDILREIIAGIMEPLEKVARVGKSNRPAKERLETMIKMLTTYSAERKEMTLIAVEQNNVLPRRSQLAVKRKQKEISRVLQQTLRDGINEGTFAVDDVKVTSSAILTIAIFVYRWYMRSGDLTADQIADRFIQLINNGILKK